MVTMVTGYVKQWFTKEIVRCVAAKERAVAQAVVEQYKMRYAHNGSGGQWVWRIMRSVGQWLLW